MRIPSAKVDQHIYFVAVDATDYTTREPGLATWTVYRSRNGAAEVIYTTPTIVEIDATNMPGVYALLVDEDTTIAAGSDSEEYCVHITHAGMAPVTRTIELYRRDTTTGTTLSTSEGDFSDILSRLVVTNSQLLVVKSDTSDVRSHLVVIHSETTAIQSDTTTLASDLAEGDFSDILSRLTVMQAVISDIQSDTNVMVPIVSDIQSDTSDIQSKLVALAAVASDIQSDTNVMVPIVSDIQSDTNVLVTKMRGVVLATGTIGATGNTTTVIHIPDTVLDSLSDDEIRYYNVVIYDVSLDEYHARTITAWTNVGDLATVSPALPFTPEASVDLYWVLPPWASQFDYDHSDLHSLLTLVRSDTAVIEAVTSDIQSDTNKLVSDATEVDTSDLHSLLTLIRSDTTSLASDLAEGDFSDIQSHLTKIYSDTTAIHTQTTKIDSDVASQFAIIEPFVSDIHSDTTAIHTQTTAIVSDTTAIHSDTTAIHTQTTKIDSDLASQFAIIEPFVSDIYSDTTAIETATAAGALTAAQDSKLTQVHSDTQPAGTLFEIVSDIYSDTTAIEGTVGGGEGDISDVLSRLTVTNSQLVVIKSDAAHIESDAVRIESMATVIKSDTSDVISALVKVYSDTSLATTAAGEPGQGAPPVSATPQEKTAYLYKAWRNRTTQTATEYALYADDAVTKDHEAPVSDDGTTFERSEVATGA